MSKKNIRIIVVVKGSVSMDCAIVYVNIYDIIVNYNDLTNMI
jgi:hypothetical protein